MSEKPESKSPTARGGVHKSSINHASSVLSKFNSRCDAIRRAPLIVIPDRIAYIFNTRDAATPEQAAAAEKCCCPLCMQAIFDGSKAEFRTCSICSRRCCEICSQETAGAVVCRSKTCGVVRNFKRGDLSPQDLQSVCERTSRDLLCQWLVLQSKREADLGPLRALYLVDARNAAMAAMEAQKKLAELAAPASTALAAPAPTEP